MPLTDLRSMDVHRRQPRDPAVAGLAGGLFAGTALLLAMIGLYGVMAYSGATPNSSASISRSAPNGATSSAVLGQGTRLVGFGIAAGLVGALLLTEFMSSLLFHVSATNPVALAGVGLVLALVTGAACFLPARRATKVDPLVALRAE